MMRELTQAGARDRGGRVSGYLVHLYTASGLACGVLCAGGIVHEEYGEALFWLLVATVIDGSDGTLARRFQIRHAVPEIDGRKLDDLVDFLNYSFLPVFMMVRAGWLPAPGWLWASVALVSSLLAFSNVSAKQEDAGFFVGFPSYWNVFAFYTAIWFHAYGPGLILAGLLACSLASVLRVRFVYPTRARKWPRLFLWGGWAWLVPLLALLWQYQVQGRVSAWLLGVSLPYPILYVLLSLYLDFRDRRQDSRGDSR